MLALKLKDWLLADRKYSEKDRIDCLGLVVIGLTIVIFTFGFSVFMKQLSYIDGVYFPADKTFPQLIGESPWKILLFCCPALIFGSWFSANTAKAAWLFCYA